VLAAERDCPFLGYFFLAEKEVSRGVKGAGTAPLRLLPPLPISSHLMQTSVVASADGAVAADKSGGKTAGRIILHASGNLILEESMKLHKTVLLCLLLILFSGCAAHSTYDMAEFRTRDVEYSNIAMDKDGLTKEQIDAIISTKPPKSFPVDISIIVMRSGYLDSRDLDDFTYNVVSQLKKSDKIDRVTLIPNYLVPRPIDFNAIQELGVRSLSEYVIVFNIDSSQFFSWTKIIETKYEIKSAINYIFVDSFTAAMLAADKLSSTQEYKTKIFSIGERRKARKELYTQQAKELAAQIDRLLGSAK
jgi:hypothetical protein